MPSDNEQRTALRCKPGDLAIVTKCVNAHFIGMLVRVIEPHQNPIFDWSVEILGAPAKGRDLRTGKMGAFRRAAVLDWNLMPLADLSCSNQARPQVRRRDILRTS